MRWCLRTGWRHGVDGVCGLNCERALPPVSLVDTYFEVGRRKYAEEGSKSPKPLVNRGARSVHQGEVSVGRCLYLCIA